MHIHGSGSGLFTFTSSSIALSLLSLTTAYTSLLTFLHPLSSCFCEIEIIITSLSVCPALNLMSYYSVTSSPKIHSWPFLYEDKAAQKYMHSEQSRAGLLVHSMLQRAHEMKAPSVGVRACVYSIGISKLHITAASRARSNHTERERRRKN